MESALSLLRFASISLLCALVGLELFWLHTLWRCCADVSCSQFDCEQLHNYSFTPLLYKLALPAVVLGYVLYVQGVKRAEKEREAEVEAILTELLNADALQNQPRKRRNKTRREIMT